MLQKGAEHRALRVPCRPCTEITVAVSRKPHPARTSSLVLLLHEELPSRSFAL